MSTRDLLTGLGKIRSSMGTLVMKINADAVGLAVLSLSTSGALLLVPDLSLASLPAS